MTVKVEDFDVLFDEKFMLEQSPEKRELYQKWLEDIKTIFIETGEIHIPEEMIEAAEISLGRMKHKIEQSEARLETLEQQIRELEGNK